MNSYKRPRRGILLRFRTKLGGREPRHQQAGVAHVVVVCRLAAPPSMHSQRTSGDRYTKIACHAEKGREARCTRHGRGRGDGGAHDGECNGLPEWSTPATATRERMHRCAQRFRVQVCARSITHACMRVCVCVHVRALERVCVGRSGAAEILLLSGLLNHRDARNLQEEKGSEKRRDPPSVQQRRPELHLFTAATATPIKKQANKTAAAAAAAPIHRRAAVPQIRAHHHGGNRQDPCGMAANAVCARR
jgi:hypothetical protein